MTIKESVLSELSKLHISEEDKMAAEGILKIYRKAYWTTEENFLMLKVKYLRQEADYCYNKYQYKYGSGMKKAYLEIVEVLEGKS